MGSSFKLKNGQDQEFSIVHNDNAGAITVASDKIVVKDASGNVGIGTNSPECPLHIKGTSGSVAFKIGNTNETTAMEVTSTLNTATIFNQVDGGTRRAIKFQQEGNDVLTLDSTGNVLLTSGTGGLGYGTGAGGTVTQETSKSTPVTLNKPVGIITMNGAALAAGASVKFAFNNSTIAIGDNIAFSISGSVANVVYTLSWWIGSGIVNFSIKNNSGASLSEAVGISFVVIKGATA